MPVMNRSTVRRVRQAPSTNPAYVWGAQLDANPAQPQTTAPPAKPNTTSLQVMAALAAPLVARHAVASLSALHARMVTIFSPLPVQNVHQCALPALLPTPARVAQQGTS